MNYYEIDITKTSKPMGRTQEDFTTFDRITEKFKTIEEVKTYLQETYGKCKRIKMYRDNENESIHVGYIYCFKDSDISHNSKPWHQQDWVEISEVSYKLIIV